MAASWRVGFDFDFDGVMLVAFEAVRSGSDRISDGSDEGWAAGGEALGFGFGLKGVLRGVRNGLDKVLEACSTRRRLAAGVYICVEFRGCHPQVENNITPNVVIVTSPRLDSFSSEARLSIKF